jgi:hypothetical protein
VVAVPAALIAPDAVIFNLGLRDISIFLDGKLSKAKIKHRNVNATTLFHQFYIFINIAPLFKITVIYKQKCKGKSVPVLN